MSSVASSVRTVLAFGCLGACFATNGAQAGETRTQYVLMCMGCHLEDGSGAPGKVPSMRESLAPLAALPEGRKYLVQVPGVAQSSLSNRELAQLLNWMMSNLSEPPPPRTFVEFTESEVAASRSGLLPGLAETRARLLKLAATATESSSRSIRTGDE